MSEQSNPERPRQVTVAAWLIMAGSLFVVATVYERMSGLHTIETRDSVQQFLSEPPGDGLGIQVDGMLAILRTLAMVAGGCATAAAILGYHVLRRSRSARVGLSLIAIPLFVTGMATGGFMSSIVVAAAVMLWFQPARDWFDGITRQAATPATRTAKADRTDVSAGHVSAPEPPPPAPASEPRAVPGFGAAGAAPLGAVPVDRGSRPSAVVWASALTWAGCGVVVLAMATIFLVLLVSPDLFFDELHRRDANLADSGMSDAAYKTAMFVFAGVVTLWSLATSVIAVLAFRGASWARVALLASSALAAMFLLIATVTNFLMVLPLGVTVATIVLLLRPDVRAWYAARGSVSP